MVGLELARVFFPERRPSAPIDARALEHYRFFARLGFFGVEPGTARGGIQFLRQAARLLNSPNVSLWVTPQGRFVDVRERPVRFQAGLGHLAMKRPGAFYLPLALEYCFWEEKQPEVLARFGPPIQPASRPDLANSAEEWTRVFEGALTACQDRVAQLALQRDPDAFVPLFRGRTRTNPFYDAWRRARAWRRGESFQLEHGHK